MKTLVIVPGGQMKWARGLFRRDNGAVFTNLKTAWEVVQGRKFDRIFVATDHQNKVDFLEDFLEPDGEIIRCKKYELEEHLRPPAPDSPELEYELANTRYRFAKRKFEEAEADLLSARAKLLSSSGSSDSSESNSMLMVEPSGASNSLNPSK